MGLGPQGADTVQSGQWEDSEESGNGATQAPVC